MANPYNQQDIFSLFYQKQNPIDADPATPFGSSAQRFGKGIRKGIIG